MTTVLLTLLIGLLVFGATWLGGHRAAQAAGDNAQLASHQRTTTCRADRCQRLRQRMWAWYRSSGAECIRRHEGAWDDPNAPYWGGFQADLNFQQAYGVGARGARYYRRWGTADHWPRFRQIHMAWRGYHARGWQPWPSTSVYCGLR